MAKVLNVLGRRRGVAADARGHRGALGEEAGEGFRRQGQGSIGRRQQHCLGAQVGKQGAALEAVGDGRQQAGDTIGTHGLHSSLSLVASMVMGMGVSTAISGNCSFQPLPRVIWPPHRVDFSVNTTSCSRSFLGT